MAQTERCYIARLAHILAHGYKGGAAAVRRECRQSKSDPQLGRYIGADEAEPN